MIELWRSRTFLVLAALATAGSQVRAEAPQPPHTEARKGCPNTLPSPPEAGGEGRRFLAPVS